MWTLDQGLALVRIIQPRTRRFSYHLALGGGVLNAGHSHHDLDLYFLPLDDDTRDSDGLVAFLERLWGTSESLEREDYPVDPTWIKIKFLRDTRRIDAFIYRG